MNSPTFSTATTVLMEPRRPVTSKARGICKYYTDPRGCYAKDKCKFIHSEPPAEAASPVLTPYDLSKTCRYYAQGYCLRGDDCWFLHTDPNGRGALTEDDDLCSICFEKPTTYGLLSGCSHIFCTACIKQWRAPEGKPLGAVDSGNTKRCPMCRNPSLFITPSSKFWPDGSEEKQKTIDAYRESMSRVQCRYFEKSLQKDKDNLSCPFGSECFYQHKMPDGTLHKFKDNAEVSMRRYRSQQNRGRFGFRFGQIPSIDIANLTFAATLNLNPHWFEEEAEPAPRPRTEAMAVAFEMLRNHIRETNGGAGPRQPGEDGADETNGETMMMMRLLDAVRDQLIPGFRTPPTGSATINNSNNPPTSSTRNGTASVADEIDDEIPPPLEDVPRGSGYASDNSMPGLRSVSTSSDSDDSFDDNDDDYSGDDGLRHPVFGNFRTGGDFNHNDILFPNHRDLNHLFRQPSDATATTDSPVTRSAPSPRFSTVVDRPSASASSGTNTPRGPLLQWAEAVLRMDREDDSDSGGSDDLEGMPALESVPDMPAASSSQRQVQAQVDPTASSTTSPAEVRPAIHLPASPETLSPLVSEEAIVTCADSAVSTPNPRRREAKEDFTTDGRGRVISVGGHDPPAEVHANPAACPYVSVVRSPGAREDIQPAAAPVMQREASEFTTDGRGRVISIGESAASGNSTGAGGDTIPGRQDQASSVEGEGEGDSGASRERRSFFSWINSAYF